MRQYGYPCRAPKIAGKEEKMLKERKSSQGEKTKEKDLPNGLSPTKEAFCLSQNYPRGEGNCETTERQNLSRGNSCLKTSRWLFWPTGRVYQKQARVFLQTLAKPGEVWRTHKLCSRNLPHIGQRSGEGPFNSPEFR